MLYTSEFCFTGGVRVGFCGSLAETGEEVALMMARPDCLRIVCRSAS